MDLGYIESNDVGRIESNLYNVYISGQNPGWLGYIGDKILPNYIGIILYNPYSITLSEDDEGVSNHLRNQ